MGGLNMKKKQLNNSKLNMQNEHRKKYLYPDVPKMSQQGSTLKGRALYWCNLKINLPEICADMTQLDKCVH